MFAYCNNNPVNSADPSGYSVSYLHQDFRLICHNATGNPLSALAELQLAAGSYGSEGQKIIDAMEAVNAYLTNTDPQAVLDSGVITFYKGVPYIKLPIGTDAFSFGGVFIGDEVGLRSDAIETVMHEYGHSVHFSQIGAANYFTYVAIPSMIGYWTDVKTVDYYSQPYEYIADVFGEVERYYNGSPYPYSSATEDWWVYWLITYL